jgi:hypothetical protein
MLPSSLSLLAIWPYTFRPSWEAQLMRDTIAALVLIGYSAVYRYGFLLTGEFEMTEGARTMPLPWPAKAMLWLPRHVYRLFVSDDALRAKMEAALNRDRASVIERLHN